MREVDPKALVGYWRAEFDRVEYFLVFDADGQVEAVYSLDSEHPFDFGTYDFDGRRLTLQSTADVTVAPCAGQSGSYLVSFSENEQTFTLPESGAEDECRRRRGELTRVLVTKEATSS